MTGLAFAGEQVLALTVDILGERLGQRRIGFYIGGKTGIRACFGKIVSLKGCLVGNGRVRR